MIAFYGLMTKTRCITTPFSLIFNETELNVIAEKTAGTKTRPIVGIEAMIYKLELSTIEVLLEKVKKDTLV